MISPEYEYLQPPAGLGVWNDSQTFTFTDHSSGTDVYIRFGRLPNQNRAHAWVLIAPPEGATYQSLQWDLPLSKADVDDLPLGIARLQMLEPLQEFRLGAEDKELQLDVHWRGLIPPIDFRGDEALRQNLAPHHYEQPATVEGHIQLRGDRYEVRGYGLRSRSWGERDFSLITRYRAVQGQIGDDYSFSVMKVTFHDGREMNTGYVQDGKSWRPATRLSGHIGGLAYGDPTRPIQVVFEDQEGGQHHIKMQKTRDYSFALGPLVCCHDACAIESEAGTGYGWMEDAVSRPATI